MKHCAFCGGEYPDELAACPLDRQPLIFSEPPEEFPPVRMAEASPIRTPLDAATLVTQIREVRRDHVAALRVLPHPISHRSELLAWARKTIASLPFFHHAPPRDENKQR